MVKYFDNEIVLGWYFYIEGSYYGDGTEKGAYKAEKNYNERMSN